MSEDEEAGQKPEKRRYRRIKAPLDAPNLPAMVASYLARALDVDAEALSVSLEVHNDVVARARYRGPATGSLVAKRFRDPRLATIAFSLMEELWRSGFDRGATDGIRIPEPLALLDDAFILMEDVPGTKGTTLAKRDNGETARLAARTLHKLHTSGARCGLTRNQGRTIRLPTPLPPETTPRLGARIDRLAFAVEAACIERLPAELAPIHRDFHIGQILVDKGTAYLLDTARIVMGDPAQDVANFLVSAYARDNLMRNLNKTLESFTAEYYSLAPQVEPRVPLYEAMALLRRIQKRLQEGDEPAGEALLVKAEERLAAAG